MYKTVKIQLTSLLCASLLSLNALAFETAEQAETACKEKSTSKVRYSMCLDEKLTKAKQSYKAWLTSRELELAELVKNTGRESILTSFKQSNAFYQDFMEAQCRRVFFEKQGDMDAADSFRLCKIEQIALRIEQLKKESQ